MSIYKWVQICVATLGICFFLTSHNLNIHSVVHVYIQFNSLCYFCRFGIWHVGCMENSLKELPWQPLGKEITITHISCGSQITRLYTVFIFFKIKLNVNVLIKMAGWSKPFWYYFNLLEKKSSVKRCIKNFKAEIFGIFLT